MSRPRTRSEASGSSSIGVGLLVGGLAGLVYAATREARGYRPAVVIGGVDLSHVDTERPFYVDFSVAADAPFMIKQGALHQVQSALMRFRAERPFWMCNLDLDANIGRFVLSVVPLFVDQAAPVGSRTRGRER